MFLPSTRQIAHQMHWCDCCCTHIMPGEEYDRRPEIYIRNGRKRVIVWKEHVNPMCEFPEPPSDYGWDEGEETKDLALPEAA